MRRVASLALAAVLWAPAARAADWPTVPLPDGSAGESVSSHMLYNGLHMRTSKLQSKQRLPDVVAFYRKAWRGQIVEDQIAGKTILGHMQGQYYITVDLRGTGSGTEATIGIMRLDPDKPRATPGQWFARPPNSEVLNDIQYLDTPGKTHSLTLRNRLSPTQNYEFYRRSLLAKGWQTQGPGCSVMVSACAVHFSSSRHRLAMTISREQDGTVIVVNQEAR